MNDDDDQSEAVPPATDVAQGLRFVHLMATQQQARVAELSASFYALLETLIDNGNIDTRAYERRRHLTIVRENEHTARDAGVHIAAIPDKYALDDLPKIDCEELLPICKGRCCKLPMVLSVQDLDERVVRWQYGQPYVIAQAPETQAPETQAPEMRCVHQSVGRCTIYDRRPGACRLYDCRRDARIWKDFDRRIPAD